jgi:hypothetical protein
MVVIICKEISILQSSGQCCDATAINTFHRILVLLYIALKREIEREKEKERYILLS